MQLCAITDRRRATQSLLSLVEDWATGGVHFIQLREKDLSPSELQSLTGQVLERIAHTRTKLLLNVNSPESAVRAVAAGAEGVHLAGKPAPDAIRRVRQAFRPDNLPMMSVPCHSLEDIHVAVQEQVDLMLFSPVFEKVTEEGSVPHGLEGLRLACAAARAIPVLALGGVTADNASDCVAAGAAGIAGIRLFAGDGWRRL